MAKVPYGWRQCSQFVLKKENDRRTQGELHDASIPLKTEDEE